MPVPSVRDLPSVVVHGGFEYFRVAELEWREPSGYEVPRNMAAVLESLFAERTKKHDDTTRLNWMGEQDGGLMNAGQITMERTEARRRLRDYRKSMHTVADAEYQAAERAYAALARGTPIVILSQAFALAKLDAKGRPLMAIARADERQVRFRAFTGRWSFGSVNWLSSRSERARARSAMDTRAVTSVPDGYALVPMVPPDVRKHRALYSHWILWEVEQWADRQINARPDRDPLLLRHLGGEAYAVVGQWDLTEVERAIMAGTRATT